MFHVPGLYLARKMRLMLRHSAFLALASVALAASHSNVLAQSASPVAKAGELIAPDWEFFQGQPLEVVGEWEVIWGKLVAPQEFDALFRGDYISLPTRWNDVDEPGMDGPFGVATFRVRLKLSDYNRDLTFHLIAPHAAYRAYLDDVLLLNNGRVSLSPDDFVANYVSRVFAGQSGESEFVLQVANFKHAYGGPGHALTLWDAQRLQQFLDTLSVVYGLVLGIMFTIGLFHLILFLADPRDRSNGPIHFWFAVLCFIIVYRVQGIIPLFHDYFPESGYWESLRFAYASLYAAPAAYLLFFRSVFPTYFPKRTTQIFITVCVVGLAFALVANEYLYSAARNFSIFLNVAAIAYSVVFTFRAMLEKESGANVILFTNVVFLATAINDAIIYTDQGRGFDLTPFGILALGLGYSYALLLRLQRTFAEARETSHALVALNRDLEIQVEDRTRAFKAAAAKAENAAREQAKFIAAASHDLRQPLHALSMFNAALKNKLRLKSETELVEKQESTIENLSTLLQDTLDTAKAEVQQKSPAWKEVDISGIFANLAGAFDIQAQSRGTELSFSTDDTTIVTDPSLLQRILGNLIDNALKAARSKVGVCATRTAHNWQFTVQDDGSGIGTEDTGKIFESYISLRDEAPGPLGGYGLGLYVVREFSRLLDGEVSVTSAENGGSLFTVRLPHHDQRHEAPDVTRDIERADASLDGTHLLVVDDEVAILEAMTALGASWGCVVRTATSLDDAQAVLRSNFDPDIVVADFHLHGVQGPDVIRAINADRSHPVPAIIITGATEPDILEAIEQAGLPMMEKPIYPDKLARLIRSLLATAKPSRP